MKRWGSWFVRSLGLLVVWVFLSFLLPRTGLPLLLDGRLTDAFWVGRWKLETGPPLKTYIVGVDEDCVNRFAEEGLPWPFPRRVYAQALERLAKLGVSVVALDMIFGPTALAADDQILAQSIASSPMKVVLGVSAQEKMVLDQDDDSESDSPLPLRRIMAITRSCPAIAAAAHAEGLIVLERKANPDGVVRRNPLAFPIEGTQRPALSLAAFLASRGASGPVQIENDLLQMPSGEAIPLHPLAASDSTLGATSVAVPSWRPPRNLGEGCGEFWLTDLHSLLSGGFTTPKDLAGSIVFLGVANDFLGDTIAIPGESNAAGVHLHAAMCDSLQRPGGFFRRVEVGGEGSLGRALLLLMGIWIVLVQARFSPFWGVVLSGCGLLALEGLAFGCFRQGYLLRTGLVLGGFPFQLAAAYITGYLMEGREKAQIRELFGKQVSPEVVATLLEDPASILVARRQEISVCFLDVCGFTSFSEKHTPERVLVQLNFYFSHLVKIIHQHHGNLDKFIGDAMMVTTGVPIADPEHAWRMVRIAMEIMEQVREINKNLPKGFVPFTLSCGINSGEAILGNVGSTERMEYTVVGDTVNLASRLQGKSGSEEIVIGQRTRELAGDRLVLEALEPFHVKGKDVPISAFRVIGIKEQMSKETAARG